jgi:glycosyltransferase involved in cell wall biosynthesis
MTGTPSCELRAAVDELQLGQNVHFVGTANIEGLAQLYRGAQAFIFPSLYEGFGLPPLEAMACGTPVLTSKVCSLPEVVGDAGILIDPLNVEEIAHGIRTLVENSDTRAKLRKKGLLRATKFSWCETARKTGEVLRMALAN